MIPVVPRRPGKEQNGERTLRFDGVWFSHVPYTRLSVIDIANGGASGDGRSQLLATACLCAPLDSKTARFCPPRMMFLLTRHTPIPLPSHFQNTAVIDFKEASSAPASLEQDGADFGGRRLNIKHSASRPVTRGPLPLSEGRRLHDHFCWQSLLPRPTRTPGGKCSRTAERLPAYALQRTGRRDSSRDSDM